MRSFTFQHLKNMMMMMLFMKIRFLTQILCSFFNPHILLATTLVLAVLLYFYLKSHHVYLIDFSCYQPPDTMRAPISSYIEHTVLLGDKFAKDSRDFLLKFFPRSGVGSEASMPESMHQIPLDVSMKNTIAEIETVLFTAVEDLLVKHNISPKSIDILVSNCSVSCPTPSITAMIINKFKFRSNIMSFSLAGMGCSAGLLSISLAKDLLKVHKNSLALVVTMEAITPHGYMGRNKSMLLTNTLFRMGGAAILVSNRKQDKTTAKYELQHLVRTNMGFDDQSYRGIVHEEDEDGTVGINLSPKLLHVAGKGLRTNSTTLGPLVLPYSELIKYGWSMICQKLCAPLWRKEVYIPDLKMAFDHFCIHAGGKRVIDAVAESLSLCEEDVEPSRMALYRFGNTSSSSIWYELCYLEAKGKMKKGDKVWQIAFGSGFKCNSGVWKCLSDVDPNVKSAWSDRIHRYPVEIPDQVEH